MKKGYRFFLKYGLFLNMITLLTWSLSIKSFDIIHKEMNLLGTLLLLLFSFCVFFGYWFLFFIHKMYAIVKFNKRIKYNLYDKLWVTLGIILFVLAILPVVILIIFRNNTIDYPFLWNIFFWFVGIILLNIYAIISLSINLTKK